jgi:hypothetical protein
VKGLEEYLETLSKGGPDMATAEVYGKWSNQTDGNRGAGGWGFFGQAQTTMGAGGINPLNQHAERLAWRQAWGAGQGPNIRTHVASSRANFTGQRYQVKFWVDQQICSTCQKWLIIDVISHLKQLSQANPGLIVELYAEVLFAGQTRRVRVQRETIWPVQIGLKARYIDLPVQYN